MTRLERSLAASPLGPRAWRAEASPDYEGMSGLFGGWSAALLLRTLLSEPDAEGTPAALTVHYLAPVLPGRALVLDTALLRGGRSLSFWQATLRAEDEPDPLCLATVVLANRRASDRFEELRMPSAPDPTGLERFQPPAQAFGQRMDIRPVFGNPAFGRKDSHSLAWIRERSGRAVDVVQLAFLADVGAPRIFFYSDGPRPSSTLTLSVYFHATPEELAAVDDDYVLSELRGTRAEHSTFGSRGELWSRQGALLATMEQLCWFR